MKLLILLLTSVFVQSSSAQPSSEFDVEAYFKNISSKERTAYIANAEVMDASWSATEIQSLDVLDSLSKACKMDYKADVNGLPVLPVVECEYQPKENQNGMTSKFRCAIENKGKKKKHKVKYSFKDPTDTKEIPQAIVSASIARLMGFYANTYCPAIVKCKGCSKNPWSDQNRSALPAVNETNTFYNAVVEVKVKGEELTVPTPVTDRRPLGWKWEELQSTLKSVKPEDKLSLQVQREAYMLYINFIYHTDADPHNNKLVCAEWTEDGNKANCTKVIALTTDYGDSFKKMDYSFYSKYVALTSRCTGGLRSPSGLISGPKITEEAKQLFLERFDSISDKQLTDLFELAQVRKFSPGSASRWIQTLRTKAAAMRSVRCESVHRFTRSNRNSRMTKR